MLIVDDVVEFVPGPIELRQRSLGAPDEVLMAPVWWLNELEFRYDDVAWLAGWLNRALEQVKR